MLRAAILTTLALTSGFSAEQPDPAARFRDDQYVRVGPGGKLHQGAQRVRYWGYIGFPIPNVVDVPKDHPDFAAKLAKVRADIDLVVERIDAMGFNLVRNWYVHTDDNYTVGDGSYHDLVAYYFHKLDLKGIRIWESGLNDGQRFGANPEDVALIDQPATAGAWQAAQAELVAGNGGKPLDLRCNHASFPQLVKAWDQRWEERSIRERERAAQWRNHYKGGLRLCDDPQVVVWELANEELWYNAIFHGSWLKLPAFFRNDLVAQWNGFLLRKYGSDAALAKAWQSLLPGESLAGGTVLLAPLAGGTPATLAINDTNPAAKAALGGMKAQYTRDDFARARGEDVLAFVCQLWIAHKQRETDRLRPLGRSTRISPVLWDCGNCYQVQASWMFQHSDAMGACAYVKGMGHDPTTRRFPFFSGLEAPPRMCWDVPWMEPSSIPGKPTFIYETQIDCRTKYRAEFPARIAALGAIQDWDIVNWHAFGLQYDSACSEPFGDMLAIYHDYLGYGTDEVQMSAMKAASAVFTQGLLRTPEKPTVFSIGRRSLYDPASMDYGRSYGDLGKRIIPTTYRHGLRVRVDPTAEDDRIDGPSVNLGVYEPNPVRPTGEIEYDWQIGHLIFDTDRVKSYAGFFGARSGPVLFRDGTTFSMVTVRNPPDMPYPVTPEEGYVAITLVALDGQPLAQSKRALLSAVSTSFNTGYSLDVSKGAGGMHDQGPDPSGPREFTGAWPIQGRAPVLVARVGATITCPGLAGMRYTFRDWHFADLGRGVIGGDGRLAVPSGKPVFVTELVRD